MIVDCISDLHSDYPDDLEGGDLLIIAGDLVGADLTKQYEHFCRWIEAQPYMKKIVIAGNHDGQIQNKTFSLENRGFTYLEDSGIEFEGLKIWGSPWTPEFCDWHFMLPRGAPIKAKWDLIPDDTDILITHGPAYSILDGNRDDRKCGCKDLRDALERVKPRLHVFGHIHEGYGKAILKFPGYGDENNTICVNASYLDEDYEPINKPIRVIL